MYWIKILAICIFLATFLVSFAAGQREVDIEVYGDSVVQTDIRTYTIGLYNYRNYNRVKSMAVRCKVSFVSVSSTLLLFKDNKTLNRTLTDEYSTEDNAVKILMYNRYNVSSLEGSYFCRIGFSTGGSNNSFFAYSMESRVNIEVNTAVICASNIGYSGYLGERAVFRCEPSYKVYYEYSSEGNQLKTSPVSSQPLHIFLNHTMLRMRCGYPYQLGHGTAWFKFCQSPYFILHQVLSLELSQINNDTVNTSSVEFICTSTSPRSMYWKVIGENGNILNLYQFNQSPHVEANITIQQTAGNTSIRISGAIVTEKSIHTVVCSTYGTRARAVAYASLLPRYSTAECEESACTCPSDVQTPEENHGTTAMYGNTGTLEGLTERVNAPSPHGTPMHQDTSMPQDTPMHHGMPMRQSMPMSKEEGKLNNFTENTHFLVGTVSLLLIIMFIMTLLMVYMIHRLRKLSQIKCDVTPTNVYSETELIDNPVYVPFSANPAESASCDVGEEKERTYVNL